MKIDPLLGMSHTLQFSAKIQELKKQGLDIISLGLGEPDFDTPEHIKKAACDALAAGMTRYSVAAGLPDLKAAIAEQLKASNGIESEPGNILVCPGAKNALFLACAALLSPGDEVVNLTPCYVSNIPILKLAEPDVIIHNVCLRSDTFGLSHPDLRAAINKRTRLVLINFPNNPTGSMLSGSDLEFLVELLLEFPDLHILSDEIYEMISFGSDTMLSPGSATPISDRVVTVGGLSKTHAMTGWRIGFLHCRNEHFKTMLKIHQQLNTNTATFIQMAALAAIKGPQDHVEVFLSKMRVRVEMYARMIEENDFLSGSIPQGGYFGFLNIERSGLNSDSFSSALLEHKQVAVLPGISFGKDFDGFVRVSLVNSTEIVAEGLKRIDDFMSQLGENQR